MPSLTAAILVIGVPKQWNGGDVNVSQNPVGIELFSFAPSKSQHLWSREWKWLIEIIVNELSG